MKIKSLTSNPLAIISGLVVLLLCACSSMPIHQITDGKIREIKPENLTEKKAEKVADAKAHPKLSAIETSYKDTIVEVLPQFFQETPQSRSVMAGSRFYANANYCEFIRRYRLKTNADFNSAINLFKYRAYHMGAQRVVFVESDVLTNALGKDVEMIIHPSLPKESATSIIVGDLYECPTVKAALY